MMFHQTHLGDVVDEMNRYQRGRIVILGGRLRMLSVTGVFSTDNSTEAFM
jgi:transmembrane sensor